MTRVVWRTALVRRSPEAAKCAFLALHLLHRDISTATSTWWRSEAARCTDINWHVAGCRQIHSRSASLALASSLLIVFSSQVTFIRCKMISSRCFTSRPRSDGQLPWTHSPDKNRGATKYWHLTLDAPFDELLGNVPTAVALFSRRCVPSLHPLCVRLFLVLRRLSSVFALSCSGHSLASTCHPLHR